MTALGLTALRRLIDELPVGERRLVCMRWSDGLSDQEIAEITSSDPVHVTTRLAALEQVLFDQLQLAPDVETDSAAAA
jgi:DNA-directed RNA polymerase specialized sigma24 family protein